MLNKFLLLIPVLLLLAIDYLSKLTAVTLYPFVKNHGIAFGMPIPKPLLILLTPALILAIIYFFYTEFPKSSLRDTSLSLILAGALGNYLDRLTYGYVIDFISIDIPLPGGSTLHYPSFNIADVYIFLGVLLVLAFYGKIKRTKSKK